VTDSERSPRLAVLIDADNVPPRAADGLFDEIARLGEASVRRIYGDFSDPRLKGWAALLPRLAINPQQQFANTVGKNASDIALVIDAMDLLHSGRFDGFCLVSSDSDFTSLASRIREQGLDVFGFGERKTPESFRQACKQFIYLENLIPASAADAPPAVLDPVVKPPPAKPSPVASSPAKPSSAKPRPAASAPTKAPPATALPLLRRAVAQLENDDGWVHLGQLGQQLAKLTPDFDSRTYGCAKLSDLVAATGAFETMKTSSGLQARIKPPRQPGTGKAGASTRA
jgi:hypothetical protein